MTETNQSGLISSAEVIEELNADTLISVAAGAGEPQKNAKLSSFASALQNEDSKIPTAETMEFVRALDAEGKPILISKNDLATVVAELLPAKRIKDIVGLEVIYVYHGETYGGLPYGVYTVFKSNYGEIAIDYTGGLFFRKFTDGETTGWYELTGTLLK